MLVRPCRCTDILAYIDAAGPAALVSGTNNNTDFDIDVAQLQIQLRYTTKECLALKRNLESASATPSDDDQGELLHELNRIEDFFETLGYHLEEIEGQRVTPNTGWQQPLSSLPSALQECQSKVIAFGKSSDRTSETPAPLSQIGELCTLVRRLRLKLSTAIVVITL